MEVRATDIPGCHRVNVRVGTDDRGGFIKSFDKAQYRSFGLREDWQEEIHTSSRRGVIRGMHFQTPPAEHAKLLYCVAGEVLDVVVDLRRGSPTFGEHRAFVLQADRGDALYVPSGLAHGFAARSKTAMMYYKITGPYAPAHDLGIAWDGFGFDWQVENPILSERDRSHPTLADFQSPFVFHPGDPAR
jgi:dTDP-4-dehydrorhamnose 3,5-epimerase